jgi:hypothetical protein
MSTFSYLDSRSPDYLDPDSPNYDQRHAALREQWKVEAGVKSSHAVQQMPREMPGPVQPERPAPQPVNSTALANAILKAGEKRRAENLIDAPAPGSTAALILQAGRRRRGEI